MSDPDYKIIISASMAGMAQILSGHPLDTIKVKSIQMNSNSFIATKNIYKQGIKYFYRGVGSPIIGSIGMNIQTFYTYSLIHKHSKKYINNYKNSTFNSLSTFISGSITGVGLSIIEAPTDLIKSRMQISKNTSYRSTIKLIGIKNIMKGLDITIYRNLSSVGFYFWGYEYAKKRINNEYLGIFLGGMTAGFLCWAPSYPLDNIKTRIQTDINGKYKGNIDCFKKVFRTFGYKGFYIGFAPCIFRSMIVNSFVFMAYELGIKYI